MKVRLAIITRTAEEISKLLGAGIKANYYFRIKTLLTKMAEDNKNFVETRDTLIKKYCKMKDGKPVVIDNKYQFTKAKQIELDKEGKELIDKEMEYDFDLIPISKAGDIEINPYTECLFKE